ncbi:MAG TPA: prepilin-type N-terminal cleavage/methylation domain-containing protein [Planctomycetota bacterium]|nr:prepilin-type N-terminal cleavage/methylation domain-containing protein [Planctomycetota bacterium]
MATKDRRRTSRGVTLVEVLVAAALGVVLIGASFAAYRSAQVTLARVAVEANLRAETTRLLDAIADELSECGSETASVVPPGELGGPWLTVQRCVDVKRGGGRSEPIWGTPVTFGCERPTEAAAASLVRSTEGRAVTLSSALAPKGFQVSIAGTVATVRIELERTLPGGVVVRVGGARRVRLAT